MGRTLVRAIRRMRDGIAEDIPVVIAEIRERPALQDCPPAICPKETGTGTVWRSWHDHALVMDFPVAGSSFAGMSATPGFPETVAPGHLT